MERFEVVVIGAGVAGAACAAGLDAGRVLLVERSAWPREKVCGCCLNSAAVASLERLGVLDRVAPLAVELKRVTLRSGARVVSFDRAAGLAVGRSELDGSMTMLAVERGVEFRSATSAVVVGHDNGAWRLRLTSGGVERDMAAGVVVAADGLTGGSLDRLRGLGTRVSRSAWFGVGGLVTSEGVAEGEIAMHVGRRGYVGLVRLRDGRVNMAAALDPAWARSSGGPAIAAGEVLRSSGVHAEVQGVRGTGLLTRQRDRVSADGLIVLGDAAGYVEPFTGEGMAWGLAGAEAAAQMVNSGLRGHALAAAWSVWHRTNVRSRQRACHAVRGVVRRPALVSALLGAVAAAPAAARLASSVSAWLERPYGAVRMGVTG